MEHVDAVTAFLDRDPRQVWARHRITGEPVFITPGTAATIRDVARREWTCLVPGCDLPISTRGGTKRDHYFHIAAVEHPGGPESADHLAAKAMLAQWATQKAATDAVVMEEQTVKRPEAALDRRPDVLVTWANGRRVALEVEYKHFPTLPWSAKQVDFDHEGIAASWLIGHTRVAFDQAGTPLLKVPALGRVLAAADRHVLLINPVTRQVGTMAGDPRFTRRLRGGESTGWLAVDDLEACELDPDRGLVTPTMRRIDAAMEEAARTDERTRAWARMIEIRRKRMAILQAAAWSRSGARGFTMRHWYRTPELLTMRGRHCESIHALPIHWHTALYQALIHDRAGVQFTIADCWNALIAASISWSTDGCDAARTMMAYLDKWTSVGLIEPSARNRWRAIARIGRVHQIQQAWRNS